MSIFMEKLKKDQRLLSIISFSLVSGWLLSVVFEGQILYNLMKNVNTEGMTHNTIAVLCHFMGLFISGFFIKKQVTARKAMITSTMICILGSVIFFLPFSMLWYISIGVIAFFAGAYIVSWSFYFKIYSQRGQRFKTAASVLIYSNMLMILINGVAVNISSLFGLALACILLVAGLLLTFNLEASAKEKDYCTVQLEKSHQEAFTSLRSLVILCLFILIITINSGLMYRVVLPAFSHHKLLTSYYWAIPYIAVLFLLKSSKNLINQGYVLHIALAMIGVSYIFFMWLDRSVRSYLMINTLMLAAFGVFDLFWWSILAEFFDYSDNPGKILGIGLSMNVLGISIGGMVGENLFNTGETYLNASLIALIIVCMMVVLLPILHMQLASFFKNDIFLFQSIDMEKHHQKIVVSELKQNKKFTDRETEIIELLLKGYTYKAIAKHLYISENTVKYHVKNIYQKLNINNKMGLIKIFSEEEEKLV
ncbi:transcriptional regulator, LuxR family [Clostridium aceticum]|uniref:Transcriptional regulator, LuxR family n=1 Tax=Clostridium aceticum TaxID=84022 RepID=A0A0D8IGT4_9CLOT|nr:helix-turn-helix transcriptional regulator [Clostridium aceticum]AKL94397.1 transcriptional regulator, LuxR family [Clostridium aceticum]KJF28376.1 hypothetical protein TZ02_03150 [Clostridium aceticum]